MLLLVLFAFLAGLVTILSPCILPILPIVLSGSIGDGKRKPLGIITGFILSFVFFTLFLSTIVSATNVSADDLRNLSVVIILIFGLSLLLPNFQVWMEQSFSLLSRVAPQKQRSGYSGGLLIGLSLGLIWTPCVGPILASVITLAVTNSVSATAALITFAYAIGTAIPMLGVMYLGRNFFQRVPWLLPNTARIQKGFGVVMILVALALFFNLHRQFQTFVLETYPSYSSILTGFEDNEAVKENLKKLEK